MKKILSVIFFVAISISGYCDNYVDLEEELVQWKNMAMATVPTLNPKAVIFDAKSHNYRINAVQERKTLVVGTRITISELNNPGRIIFQGKVDTTIPGVQATGVYLVYTSGKLQEYYGSFNINNDGAQGVTLNKKTAGPLVIEPATILFQKSSYKNSPYIISYSSSIGRLAISVKDNDIPGIASFFSSFDVTKLSDKDRNSPFSIVKKMPKESEIVFENKKVFRGEVAIQENNGNVIIEPLFGVNESITLKGYKSNISVNNGADGIFMQLEPDLRFALTPYNLFKVYYNDKNHSPINSSLLWDVGNYLGETKAYITYRNKDTFEGKVLVTQTDRTTSGIDIKPLYGRYVYCNGDVYEGDVALSQVHGAFVHGETYFVDGTKQSGDWVSYFDLSDEQWKEVEQQREPTSKRSLMRNLDSENTYRKLYTYYIPSNQYETVIFTSLNDKINSHFANIKSILLDKQTGIYEMEYKIFTNYWDYEGVCYFTLDNKGRYNEFTITHKLGADNIKRIVRIEYFRDTNNIQRIVVYSDDGFEKVEEMTAFSDGILKEHIWYEGRNFGEEVVKKQISYVQGDSGGYYTVTYNDRDGEFERREFSYEKEYILTVGKIDFTKFNSDRIKK